MNVLLTDEYRGRNSVCWLHFVAFRVLFEMNFAFVSKRYRLYGCLLLFMSLYLDKISVYIKY